jgi:hypothetical protein
MVRRGLPELRLRLEPAAMEALKERAEATAPDGAGERGRAGGVAYYVRRLIYEDLGRDLPDQWGLPQPPSIRTIRTEYLEDVAELVRRLRQGDKIPTRHLDFEIRSACALLDPWVDQARENPQGRDQLLRLLGWLCLFRFRQGTPNPTDGP